MTILVTGGAGFIGSNFVLGWLRERDEPIVNLDILSYAGNLSNLSGLSGDERHVFYAGDIGDVELVARLLRTHRPRVVVNFAAESHVDRSISGPEGFIHTNVVGTLRLMDCVKAYLERSQPEDSRGFRFVHVSTDEVYGSLALGEPAFTESHRYAPNSPYAASKAASDHVVRAYHKTFGIPVVTTHCSNNYGPRQFPEKLIPLCIHRALEGAHLPVYGDGKQRRDWIHVEDHCEGVMAALDRGRVGEVYNLGGESELENIMIVETLCRLLDELRPRADGRSYSEQIRFVQDRLGHDRRYAVDISKARAVLGWKPRVRVEDGLRATVEWYLENGSWSADIASGAYLERRRM
jgi:dTDP-glucose 4,6-dehydratase